MTAYHAQITLSLLSLAAQIYFGFQFQVGAELFEEDQPRSEWYAEQANWRNQ